MIITSTKNSATTAQSVTTTTPAAAAAGKRLYFFFSCDNAGGTITPPTGISGTLLAPVGGAVTVACWYIDLAGAPAADYTASTTIAAGNIALIILCVDMEGGAFVSDTVVTRAFGTGTTATTGTATNAGDVSALLAAFDFDVSATIATPPSGMTLQQHADMDSSELAVYSEIGFTTGTRALVWSVSEEWSCYGVVVRATAAAAGPTIDTQPVADTGLINGDAARRTTVYTVEASSVAVGGVTGIVWNEDATPISDGGVYDIQTTGLGTASASSTLTITRTVKTGTPFVIDADVTDADGTTASDAVNDTWYTGPVLSASSGTTNASGVNEITITSDYPNADGEFTVVPATAGGVSKQVSLHYETAP